MKNSVRWLFLFSIIQISAYGQLPILSPNIVRQTGKIETNQNTPVAISFGDLVVTDFFGAYPTGFTMTLYEGTHYSFVDNVVTPDLDYHGNLDVDVTVAQGLLTSNRFTVRINVKEVKNTKPHIDGQAVDLSTPEQTPITLKLEDLLVTDPDKPEYPTGFTLTVEGGKDYKVDDATVTPEAGVTGAIKVRVTVYDGQDESNKFDVTITVTPVNKKPVINNQVNALSTFIGTPIQVEFGDISVTDDNPYPGSFTMTLYDGTGYTVSDRTITPTGTTPTTLKVLVSVFDGNLQSDQYELNIGVTAKPNVKPKITDQVALKTVIQTPITVKFEDLIVEDPDNSYPTGFTMTLYDGTGYTVSGRTVTPTGTLPTTLSVQVSVRDGAAESDKFPLQIVVDPKPNEKPKILSQKTELTTNANTPITLGLQNLNVQDPDNDYPKDFTMRIIEGTNYKVNNLTITPAAGFIGPLDVQVVVNDGKLDSDPFPVKITVNETPNHVPEITGQSPLSTFIGVPITLRVTNLNINDPDNTYPDDFILKVYKGNGYTFSETTITPNLLFIGTLSVNVTVTDGKNESLPFPLKITVNLVPNVAPKITGQKPLSTFVNQPITINFDDLIVEDPDNVYPTGFKISLTSGPNYSVSSTTITPANGFDGTLNVPVSVNDGVNDSPTRDLKITVTKSPNVAPEIVGQVREDYNVDEDKTFQITLDMLKVTDPDNTYPKDFKLTIAAPGSDATYSVSDDKVTPSPNYDGAINVSLKVNDGTVDSNPYAFRIKVNPVNDPPKISQKTELTTFVQTPLELKIDYLTIEDPDNDLSTLSFKVLSGSNYNLNGNVITPAANFADILKVNVSVSDGTSTVPFQMAIRVLSKPNIPPVISGQHFDPLKGIQNTELAVKITDLDIVDDDQEDHTRFTLKLSPGANYTVKGNSIIPATNYVGALTVPVTVNDGTDDSAPYGLRVNIALPSAKPTIIGQNPIATDEDVPVNIALGDLLVTDTDDVYPKGFTLQVRPGPGYTNAGSAVTPVKDFNGFLIVSVTVTDDDGKVSDPYAMAVLVRPIDDAPVIAKFETTDISYEPGKEPIFITSILEVDDVDNDHLSFAEVSIDHRFYQKNFDQLLFDNTTNIRGIFDADSGKLSLIGYAPLQEYQDALRSVKYNFELNDTEGQPNILPANKSIYFMVHDGQKPSSIVKRNIIMETNVSIHIPTAFSPNDDQVNETWQVIALSNAEQCENAVIKVYDKRGLLLFQSIGLEKKWDGKYNGQLLPTDTYFYTVDLMLSYAKKTYKGAVTIVR